MSRQQAIRPRDESEDDEKEVESDIDPSESDTDENENKNENENETATEDDDNGSTGASSASDDPSEDSPEQDLKEISFGALAEAQTRFQPPSRKRKRDTTDDDTNVALPDQDKYTYTPRKEPYKERPSRSSKHAPTQISSRNPVTRRREIFSPPPAAKFRDPRFDAAITSDARHGNTSSTHRATQNYAFLTDYQATEILALKSQLKKAKDPNQQAQLKRDIMSLDAKVRNAQTRKREAEILQEHKRKEKEAIKQGKKARPYFLKPSEVKKQIDTERQEAMGKRARDKSEKRKKKREKTKEARDMPRVRRVAA